MYVHASVNTNSTFTFTGTLNNLGKYIYFAFALRKQLTHDNWKIQPPTVIFISIFPFLSSHFVYTCAPYLVTICDCIVKCLYDDEMFKSQIKDYLSIYLSY